MGYTASDFQRGVEWAAGVVKKDGFAEEAAKILAECPPDLEGTEARTVKQIVAYLRETAEVSEGAERQIKILAGDIERGEWKPR